TGNTAASAAAYGAAAGLEVVVVLPAGQIAAGKLVQAQLAGARVIAVDGNFDAALRIVRELVAQGASHGHPLTLVNSVNPHRIAGQKTGAFEVCDDLGGAPDYLAIPVGNAGNITAYWRGFTEYRDAGLVETRPMMLGFQAAGAAPLVLGHDVADPATVATAIRIGHPASGDHALRARDESSGLIDSVTDEEILAAYRELAGLEGVFCEPASAAAVAGVRKVAAEGRIDPSATIVCVLTGHGLKDPATAQAQAAPVIDAAADAAAVMEALGW
ncbi:MAG TPA: threonine synthase, partial [Candidatus Limnocylindrales bacterium]